MFRRLPFVSQARGDRSPLPFRTLLCVAAAWCLAPVGAGAQPVLSPPIDGVFAGGQVSAIVRQPDGKVVVGGSFDHVNGVLRHFIARLNTDGSLDTGWDANADGGISALAVDAGGDLFVGGSFQHIGGLARAGLAKLSPGASATADATWNPIPPNAVSSRIYVLLADSSGSLYVGGGFSTIGGQARANLARLSVSGSGAADATWDPSPNGNVIALALDESGGNLFVAGGILGFKHIGGLDRRTLAKISISGVGAADPAWDPQPSFTCAGGECGRADALALDGSGNLFVGGFFGQIGGQTVSLLAKLSNATGAADASWTPNPNGEILALAFDAGNVYAAGVFGIIGGQPIEALAKIADAGVGTVDPNWHPVSFIAQFFLPGEISNNPVNVVVPDGSGNLYAGGSFVSAGGLTKTGFAVLSESGTGAADPAYACVMLAGTVAAIVRDASGRTVIGGNFEFMGDGVTVRNGIARLNADGSLDSTWLPEASGEVEALALDPVSGSIYAAGLFTTIGGQGRNHIARLSGSGSGAADIAWNPNADGDIRALALDTAGGAVYAAGSFANVGGQARNNIAKLALSGSGAADPVWNPDTTPGDFGDTMHALALDGAGNLYAGGNFLAIGGQTRSGIAKLSTSGAGAADPTWNPAATSAGAAKFAYVLTIALDGSGNVYAGGAFDHIGGRALSNLARLSPSGTGAADTTWHPNASGSVSALVLDGSGIVYAGGNFGLIGGGLRSEVARLLANGSADCNWIANAESFLVASSVQALALDGSGDLYVGGGFENIGGTGRQGYAALGPTTTTAGCRLAITGVNAGLSPSAGIAFGVAVQSQDSIGNVQNVVGDTVATLSRHTGTGVLGGVLSCQIPAGTSSCTDAGVTYSKAESGVVLTASSTSGDALAPGNSAPFSVIATPPPDQLAFTSINGGTMPIAASPFFVTIQAQDGTGTPRNVLVDTSLAVGLGSGSGVLASSLLSLGSALQCTIPAGANACNVNGLVYSKAEAGVILTAVANYGAGVLGGNSQPFTVGAPAGGAKVLTVINAFADAVTSNPPGINCASSDCAATFASGTPVTLTFTGPAGNFNGWGGACSGPSLTCVLNLNADATAIVNEKSVSSVSFTSSFAFQVAVTVVGSETHRIDESQTRIVGRYKGAIVYDQTFAAPFSDPAVQAAVTAAGDAVRTAGGSPPVQVTAPILTGQSDSLLSSVTQNQDVVTASPPAVTVTLYDGPQTLDVGFLGLCVQAPANCSGPFSTFTLAPGFLDFYILTVEQSMTSRTIVTTDTYLLASNYEVDDEEAGAAIPTLNELGLLLLAAAIGTLSLHRLRQRRQSTSPQLPPDRPC
ncbi:MAG: IPTL-CTERM sorting domain-containing protein [Thermoanaerobaculales bacterium]